MTLQAGKSNQGAQPTGRASRAVARMSRRPSRLGRTAGSSTAAQYPVDPQAGFPSLLASTWRSAIGASTLDEAVRILVSLDTHLPADFLLRALTMEEECAVWVLFNITWRADRGPAPEREPDEAVAFLGEIGLTTAGRLAVRLPSAAPLSATHTLVGGVLRVPWNYADLVSYEHALCSAGALYGAMVEDARAWLAYLDVGLRVSILDDLKEGALRTAPFILYVGDRQYTNFRDRNTIVGKTLWPGHPDCTFSRLASVPPRLWSSEDVLLIVSLTLLVRSTGYARIEEANGTQVTPDHVAYLLERTRLEYARVRRGKPVAPADSSRVDDLQVLADALRLRRGEITPHAQLYREIHGPLVHKIEKVCGPAGEPARAAETMICHHLTAQVPKLGTGTTFMDLKNSLATAPQWLVEPVDEYGTGVEKLIHNTVSAAVSAFGADFAMSRGMRSLSDLVHALQAQDWSRVVEWELPRFYCCVVPAPSAIAYFDHSIEHLADIAWSMSARMQYNSWHFAAGNLPSEPAVVARDYFIPPESPTSPTTPINTTTAMLRARYGSAYVVPKRSPFWADPSTGSWICG